MKRIYLTIAILISLAGVMKAQVPVFWGMSEADSGRGNIFHINADGTGYTSLYNFVYATGIAPVGELLQASNGKLYGACKDGGLYSSCTVFSFDQTTNSYSDLYDFDITHGDIPVAGLIEATNHKLYGVGNQGGALDAGVIYSMDFSTNTYTDLYDFDWTHGKYPQGKLLQATDGKLYGVAEEGGTSNTLGTLYSYDIAANSVTALYNFTDSLGSQPMGSLIQANDGKLYGTAMSYTLGYFGAIYSFDLITNQYSVLHIFQHATGDSPYSGLFQASNGLLYSVNTYGGAYNLGVLYSFDITTSTYTVLFNFNDTLGYWPSGNFIESNGKIYSMANNGGAYHHGLIYSIDINTNTYTDIFDFDGINGDGCAGGFITLSPTTSIPFIPNKATINIFPNPATTSLTIHSSQLGITNYELQIMDVFGRKMYQQVLTTTDTKIDVSHWSEGVYFYELNGERGKFIVN